LIDLHHRDVVQRIEVLETVLVFDMTRFLMAPTPASGRRADVT